tara:strand:+ start:307 stop:942 length:636 start_codon:yes stop_codon:yes gene_type:complete
MKLEYKFIKHFGPSVFKVKIPQNIVQDLNDYVDKIILDNKKQKELDYGNQLIGDVAQEFKLEKEIMEKSGWIDFLGQSASKWIELQTEKKITKFELIESWIVRQFKNEYNPVHWHSGHLSGAGFLKIPSSFGNFLQKKDSMEYPGGALELIHGSKAFLSNAKYRITPKVGDFYFFPNYLMHTVYPFKDSDDERRSISFNAKIDDGIYNDYS